MAATAGDTVRGALRLIQALTRGETMPASDGEDGLLALNDLLHSWYADNVLVPSLTREELSLSVGKAEYTIGDGADLDTTRPMSISSLVVRDGGTDYYLDEIPQEWWAAIAIKDIKARPQQFYYEESYPNGTLRLDYEPDSAYPIFLSSYKPFSDFADLSDEMNLPPMYERALRFNLAMDLAPEYGREVPQTVAMQAEKALNDVRQRNFGNRPQEAEIDYSLTGRARKWDIRSDW